MSGARRLAWLLPLAGLAVLGGISAAQEPAQDPQVPVNKQQIDEALKLTRSEAAKYGFTLENSDATVTVIEQPVLRWSNPAAGEIHGNVFLWSAHGRPVVVGSLFKWFTPHTHMSHEFHSLAEVPVKGTYVGTQVWTTREGGLKFAPIDGAPKPAASAAQRLVQLRRLAKEFAATKKDREGNQQELRFLPQPIFRYAAERVGVLDGGLFVFVQGTDPEVFLLLEARGDADEARWTFGASRMNSVGFQLRQSDREVWSKEIMPWRDVGSHAEIYTSFMFKMP